MRTTEVPSHSLRSLFACPCPRFSQRISRRACHATAYTTAPARQEPPCRRHAESPGAGTCSAPALRCAACPAPALRRTARSALAPVHRATPVDDVGHEHLLDLRARRLRVLVIHVADELPDLRKDHMPEIYHHRGGQAAVGVASRSENRARHPILLCMSIEKKKEQEWRGTGPGGSRLVGRQKN